MFCVCRGKITEGIDFSAVCLVGVPYPASIIFQFF